MASPPTRHERKKVFEQLLLRIEPLLNEGNLEEASFQLSLAKEIDPDSVIVHHLEERLERLKRSLQSDQPDELADEDQTLQLARMKYEEEARRLEEQRRRMEDAKRRFEEESRLFEEQRHIAEEERIKYEVDRIKKERYAQDLSELRRRADIERRKYEEEVRKYEELAFLGQDSRFKFEEELRKREERRKQMHTKQQNLTGETQKYAPPASPTPRTFSGESDDQRKRADVPTQKRIERQVEREYLQPFSDEPLSPLPAKKISPEDTHISHKQPVTYSRQRAGRKTLILLTVAGGILIAGAGIAYYFSSIAESPTMAENLAPPAPKETTAQTTTEKTQPKEIETPQLTQVDTIIQSLFQEPATTEATTDTPKKALSAEELRKAAEPEPPQETPPETKEAEAKELPKEKPKTASFVQSKEGGFPLEQEDPTLEETGELTIHTVKSGETIEAISWQYKVTVRQIVKWNGLPSPKVKPKQELYIFHRKR